MVGTLKTLADRAPAPVFAYFASRLKAFEIQLNAVDPAKQEEHPSTWNRIEGRVTSLRRVTGPADSFFSQHFLSKTISTAGSRSQNEQITKDVV